MLVEVSKDVAGGATGDLKLDYKYCRVPRRLPWDEITGATSFARREAEQGEIGLPQNCPSGDLLFGSLYVTPVISMR